MCSNKQADVAESTFVVVENEVRAVGSEDQPNMNRPSCSCVETSLTTPFKGVSNHEEL